MADLALSATQTLLAALQCNVLNELHSMRGYKAQLDKLKETVSTIQKVLLDADAHPQLSAQQQEYVEKLKDAVYDADDLFDEFLTLAQLKKLNKGSKGALKKVSDFFSSKNSLVVAYNTSKEVKKIRGDLESIADNHKRFGLQIDSEPIRKRREETCHYVYKPDIVGRENDVTEVIDRLLGAPDTNVDFLTIVGFGGLGKTAVAQLVFDDERVKKEFAIRLWVCVSDQNGHQFDVKDILLKVLDAADYKFDASSSKERAFNLFQKALGEKKCLLVLDDVWNENLLEWNKLRDYLMLFGRGSRILATTRSMQTARVIGGGDTRTYDLKGLSDEDSSNLFNLTASGDEGNTKVLRHPEFVKISKKILKKCSNVPLAIKVAGSHLFDQEMSKWRAFEENGLRDLSLGGDNIIPILKLSYDNLESSLKNCFSYCAVFPKDFKIEKEMLISLWMAQGYVEPLYDGQSLEDAAEDHFSILLRKCFFQDVIMDNYGDIMACKVHDLMHDVAQEVAGGEMCLVSNSGYQKARHLFEDRQNFKNNIFVECKVRSYLQIDRSYCYLRSCTIMLEPLVANWKCLRSLSINHASIEKLPSSVGKLLHLRYINLFYCNRLKKLPNTIANLHNLQTLILNYCESLKELPKDFSKLVHLRHLDISRCKLLKELPKDFSKLVHLRHLDISHCDLLEELPKDFSKLIQLRHLDTSNCDKLTCMPSGIGKLTRICRLNEFKVGNGSSCGQLKDLKGLVNLRGHLDITIPENLMKENEGESGYLVGMEHLKSLKLFFEWGWYDDEERGDRHETLMSKLQPHANLREFELWNYMGRSIARWGENWASFLPNLVHIGLWYCRGLQHLPTISQLEHLRSLTLCGLIDMEYVEEDIRSDGGALSSRTLTFFPSLVQLYMDGMPRVKGWFGRKGVELVANEHSYSFPTLAKLTIKRCPNLVAMPSCPALDEVYLGDVNRRLRLKANPNSEIKVSKAEIGHVTDLGALPPCHLTSLSISEVEVENFSGAGEVFQAHNCFSLRHLHITNCRKLRSLKGGGFQHLTNLQSLTIVRCKELKLNEEDDGDGIPWRSLHHSLISLHLGYSDIKDLIVPTGVRYLINLQQLSIRCNQHLEANLERISCLSSLKSLTITHSSALKSIPEGIRSLTSLRLLQIHSYSAELEERCRNPDGEDWPKIQHITDLQFRWW